MITKRVKMDTISSITSPRRRLSTLASAPPKVEPTTWHEKLQAKFHREKFMSPATMVMGNWGGAGQMKTPPCFDGGTNPVFAEHNRLELLWLPIDPEKENTLVRHVDVTVRDETVSNSPVEIGCALLHHRDVRAAVQAPNQVHSHRLELKQSNGISAGSVNLTVCFKPAACGDDARLGAEIDDILVITVLSCESLYNVQRKVVKSVSEINSPWPMLIAVPACLLYIAVGVAFYIIYCEFNFLDALYLTFVTFTTVGYGDHSGFGGYYDEDGNVDKNVAIFASVYMVLAVIVMGTALSIIAGFLEAKLEGSVEKLNEFKKWFVKERCSEHIQHHCRNDVDPNCVDVCCTCLSAVSLLALGTLLFSALEGVPYHTGLYFACATVTTVGFGDISPSEDSTKILALFFLPLGTMIVAKALNDIAGILEGIKQSNIESIVMSQFGDGLDYSDFADLKKQVGSDEHVPILTKQEFLLAMLIRLGRLKDSDTKIIYEIYAQLDADGGGSIGLEDCKPGSIPHPILELHGMLYDDHEGGGDGDGEDAEDEKMTASPRAAEPPAFAPAARTTRMHVPRPPLAASSSAPKPEPVPAPANAPMPQFSLAPAPAPKPHPPLVRPTLAPAPQKAEIAMIPLGIGSPLHGMGGRHSFASSSLATPPPEPSNVHRII
jgi:hypothetical protein